MTTEFTRNSSLPLNRRSFLGLGAGAVAAGVTGVGTAAAAQANAAKVVNPPQGKRILLACKLGMLPKEIEGKQLNIVQRLQLAGQAGFDGVDFDQAGRIYAGAGPRRRARVRRLRP